jgi:hypothetical protein
LTFLEPIDQIITCLTLEFDWDSADVIDTLHRLTLIDLSEPTNIRLTRLKCIHLNIVDICYAKDPSIWQEVIAVIDGPLLKMLLSRNADSLDAKQDGGIVPLRESR